MAEVGSLLAYQGLLLVVGPNWKARCVEKPPA